jgi:phosphoribosylanthranilate isomerase
MMHVQIYGAWSLEDAEALVDMGLDHLGVEWRDDLEDRARAMLDTFRGRTTVVILPIHQDLDRIAQMAQALQPDVVHLCPNDLPTPEELGAFRRAIDPVKLMMAIPVAAAPHAHRIDSVGIAVGYDPYADFFLLDTKLLDEDDPVPGYLGITGKVHDWTVSRAIVEACKTPVILAGGLNPDNVAEGIRQVKPWGVDANTQLNLERGRKDLPKCRAFIDNARAAAAELGL